MTREEYIRNKVAEFFKDEVTFCEIDEETMEVLPSDVSCNAEELVESLATFSIKPYSIQEKGYDVIATYQDITAIISKDMTSLKLQYNSDLCIEIRNIAACPARQLRNFITIVNLAFANWLQKWKEDTRIEQQRIIFEKRLAEMQAYFDEHMQKPVKYKKYMQLRTLYYNIQAMKQAMSIGSYEWKYQYSVMKIYEACDERGISYDYPAWRDAFYSMPKQYDYTPVDEATRQARLHEHTKMQHLLKICFNRAIIDFYSLILHNPLAVDVHEHGDSPTSPDDRLLIYLILGECAYHKIYIPVKHYDALKNLAIEGIMKVNEIMPKLMAEMECLDENYYIYTAYASRDYSTLYPFCLAKRDTDDFFGYDIIEDDNIPVCKTLRRINTILNGMTRDLKNKIKKESRA